MSSGGKPRRDPLFGDYLGKSNERLSGPQPDAARSAARRGWCIKRGQAQRWWHNENICNGLLPFEDEALAASVGTTAAALNACPPSWEAADVVFDALSRSQSGIVDKTLVDERRASWQAADGAFDAQAFAADLGAARRSVAVAYAIFPGMLNVVFLIAFVQAGGPQEALAAYEHMLQQMDANMAIWTGMASGH